MLLIYTASASFGRLAAVMSLELLLAVVTRPKDEKTALTHAKQNALLELLEKQRTGDWLMLYGSAFDRNSFFLHSVLVPASDVPKMEADDQLTHWSGNPYTSWSCGLTWGGGEPPRVEFHEPEGLRVDTLKNAQQLVFGRSFEGRSEDKHYYEITQFLVHAHGLHWIPERHAWSKFDDDGDIEDLVVLTEEKGRGGYGTATCIVIRRDVLEMHMSATGTALVQMFDSTVIPENFHGWSDNRNEQLERDRKRGLFYHAHVGGPSSYFRGVQIIKPQRTKREYGAYLYQLERQPKKYESFITQDWKNKRVAPVSCAPEAIASYFEKDSPLPFHTSPVFFNAAVLEKYKADPEKYSLEHRSITCRNSWSLQTYDVNTAGQVHTYIKYLGDLPHSEQVYWKSFNEEPKAPISKRAYKTDFEGDWDMEPDSLRDLQYLIDQLHTADVAWFTLREPDLAKQLHYPLTNSAKAWGEVVSTLAKVINEGLEKKFFKKRAKDVGGKDDPKWGSILWAKEALTVAGTDESVVSEVIQPLLDLQAQRSKLSGAHSGGEEAKKLRAKLLREHKTPRGHVDHLCGQLLHSLQTLKDLLK